MSRKRKPVRYQAAKPAALDAVLALWSLSQQAGCEHIFPIGDAITTHPHRLPPASPAREMEPHGFTVRGCLTSADGLQRAFSNGIAAHEDFRDFSAKGRLNGDRGVSEFKLGRIEQDGFAWLEMTGDRSEGSAAIRARLLCESIGIPITGPETDGGVEVQTAGGVVVARLGSRGPGRHSFHLRGTWTAIASMISLQVLLESFQSGATEYEWSACMHKPSSRAERERAFERAWSRIQSAPFDAQRYEARIDASYADPKGLEAARLFFGPDDSYGTTMFAIRIGDSIGAVEVLLRHDGYHIAILTHTTGAEQILLELTGLRFESC